jgi:hypothetical protein
MSLMQDENRKLSLWLANRVDSRRIVTTNRRRYGEVHGNRMVCQAEQLERGLRNCEEQTKCGRVIQDDVSKS